MTKVFKILEGRQNKKVIKNREKVPREWEEGKLKYEGIIFSLDIKKIFSN